MRERLKELGEKPQEAQRHAWAVANATPGDLLGTRSSSYRRGGGTGGRAPKRRSAVGRKTRNALRTARRPSRSVRGRKTPQMIARSPTR
jgi:hypothetical protein